jgi:hypothetical protein
MLKGVYERIVGIALKRRSSARELPMKLVVSDFNSTKKKKKNERMRGADDDEDEDEDEIKKTWKVFSDGDYGGLSEAKITTRDSTDGKNLVFHGLLNTNVPVIDERLRAIKSLKRSGFAGFTCQELKLTNADADDDDDDRVVTDEISLEHFTHIRIRMKSDGRAYVCSVKTKRDSFGGGEDDLWQAFLVAPKNELSEITIPFEKFIKTYRGGVVENQMGKENMRRGGIRTIGFAAAAMDGGKGSIDGEFRCEFEKIEVLRLLDTKDSTSSAVV